MADRRNFLLQPHLPKIARNSKFVLPKSHYIYLCTYSVYQTLLENFFNRALSQPCGGIRSSRGRHARLDISHVNFEHLSGYKIRLKLWNQLIHIS